jgi:hypothetical protein
MSLGSTPRQRRDGRANALDLIGSGLLLAREKSEIARAQIGVQPLLIDERGLVLFFDFRKLARIKIGGVLERGEGAFAFVHIDGEVHLFSVLKLSPIKERRRVDEV